MTTSLPSPLTDLFHLEVITKLKSLGKKRVNSCFPEYSFSPSLLTPGSGRKPLYPPIRAKFANSSFVRVVSSLVRMNAPVMKSLIQIGRAHV
jgi:hypothetical protein